MSDSNQVRLLYVAESAWDTPPTTPTMKTVRITGESFTPEITNIQSNEIRADRNTADTVQTSRQNSGSFEFEVSPDSFDDFIAAALFSTWHTNVCKNGILETSFTFEKGWIDITRFILYSGMVCNTFSMSLKTGAIATGSFGFLGGDASVAATSLAGTKITAATTTKVLNCMNNVANLHEGATYTNLGGVYVQEVSFALNNNVRTISGIGHDTPQDTGVGKLEITGNLSAILNATSQTRLMEKFLAGTPTKLKFTMQDAGVGLLTRKFYTFEFPNIKFESESLPTGGQSQDIIENIGFRALYSASELCMIKVTRDALA